MTEPTKVGIIACSGEEIAVGTVARQAVRRVLELLRPQSTVTLCLPLFLAGEEQERRFARQHPTITVDGCAKLCAKRGTEQYSGQVSVSLVVSDILGERAKGCHRSTRDFDRTDEEAAWLVSERIAAEVDALREAVPRMQTSEAPEAASCACSCGSTPGAGNLQIGGRTAVVNGLPLIFDHLYKTGLAPGNGFADRVLETVGVYHEIPPTEECIYRDALAVAYAEYHGRRTR